MDKETAWKLCEYYAFEGSSPSKKILREKRLKKEKCISKTYAHSLVSAFVNLGVWESPDVCDKCKKTGNIRAHHENYFQPLRVDWLCGSCHQNRHVELTSKGMDPGDSFSRKILESPEGDNYLNRLRQFYIQVAELSTELFDEDFLESPNVLENTVELSLSYRDEENNNV